MKKLCTTLMTIVLISSFVFPQTQLSFRFSNPLIIEGNPDLFQFDVEIMADETGTFLRDLQIYFDYNSLAFGSSIFTNGKVTVSNLALMNNHYQMVNSADNKSSKFAVILEATEEMNHPGSAWYFNEVPITYTGLLRFQIKISDTAQTSGITFDQELMNGGQYMQATASTDPISYQFTNIYDNSLTNLSLTGQKIQLTSGWSGISSYLVPFNEDVETLFNPIINELDILENYSGFYFPAENVNTLGFWNSASGYMVKVNSNCQLRIMGSELDIKTIALTAGWNLFPVLSSCEVNTAELFSEILSNVMIIKEVAGTGVYWPSMGINTIPYLNPGKAYFVKMTTTGEIEFPICGATQ
jgi:hypothetical protein